MKGKTRMSKFHSAVLYVPEHVHGSHCFLGRYDKTTNRMISYALHRV